MSKRSCARVLAASSLVALAILLVAGCVPPAPAPSSPATAPAAPASTASGSTPEAGTSAIPLEGPWEGSIKVAGQDIAIVVKFAGSGDALKATLDIPPQGLKDSPLANLSYQHPRLHFEAFQGARLARFDGAVTATGGIEGDFQQAGYKGSFSLLRAIAAATPVVPYRHEEVIFKNGDVTLAGTLSMPPSGGPFPAVVLISGSGQQNRDEDVAGFPVFGALADHLTRNGIAVLRYDDRGVGGSVGDVIQATSEDFAGDVVAAVNLLEARAEIDPKRIGVLGHSEGGIIAPMVAGRSEDVSFVILLAGPALTGETVIKQQLVDILKAAGTPQAEIDKAVADQERTIAAVQTGKGWDELKAQWREKALAQIQAMPEEQRKAFGDPEKAAGDAVAQQVQSVDNPWFKFFLSYDPAPALASLRVPVLALYGGKDTQVAAGPNEAAARAALANRTNQEVTVKTFPAANHLFQEAQRGDPGEYATLKPEFAPGVLEFITDWIKQAVR